MVSTRIDETGTAVQNINAIWIHFSQFGNRKVMVPYYTRILRPAVFRTIIFEIANILFFLCTNRDYRITRLKVLFCQIINDPKLFITIRTPYSSSRAASIFRRLMLWGIQ